MSERTYGPLKATLEDLLHGAPELSASRDLAEHIRELQRELLDLRSAPMSVIKLEPNEYQQKLIEASRGVGLNTAIEAAFES